MNYNDINHRIHCVMWASGKGMKLFLADVGLSKRNLTSMVRNKWRPKLSVLQAISNKYNVSYTWLIEGLGSSKRTA